MRALRDFEAYWMMACEGTGGTVDDSQGIRMHAPQGGPPVNGILQAAGLDLDEEIPTWQARGTPFGLTSTDEDTAAAARRNGMTSTSELVLVEAPVRDLGPPTHAIGEDVDAFVEILMVTHDIPPFVKAPFAASVRHMNSKDTVQTFVAFDDGPAGCAALFTGTGHAGLYAFGVLPDKRRTGVATSLFQACMQAARTAGVDTLVAATTPDGLAFAGVHGAKEVGVIQQFAWFPGPPA